MTDDQFKSVIMRFWLVLATMLGLMLGAYITVIGWKMTLNYVLEPEYCIPEE